VIDFRTKSILDERKDYVLGYGYKLSDAGQYGLDAAFNDQFDINESEMSITFPFADGKRRDGVGDLLEIGGIRTERHQANPIVLFDHGKQVQLPIGLAEDPYTKQYTITIDVTTQTALCKAFFYQGTDNYDHAVFCEQLFDLMAKRYVRAGSIGYQVIAAKELQANYDTGTPKGLHLLSVLMLEASAVVLPANQDTVRKALSLRQVCGKPLSPVLVKSLQPYADNSKILVGFEQKSALDKEEFHKDISEIRHKYKKSKNLRRRVKRSSPGSSVVYLRSKDLDEARKFAESKGVKFVRTGVKGHLEKVRLTGDDDSIDLVAKRFGRSQRVTIGTKSMNVKTKEMPDNPVAGDEAKKQEGKDKSKDKSKEYGKDAPEKFSAQAIRRMHEDYSILIGDYDTIYGQVENPDIADLILEELEHLEEFLSLLEDVH